MTLATVEANTEPPQNREQVHRIAQLLSSVASPKSLRLSLQRPLCSHAHQALFTRPELWYQPGCPAAGEWIKTAWHTCAVKFICRKMDIPGDYCLRKTTTPRFLFVVSRFYGDKRNHMCLWFKRRSRTVAGRRRQWGRGGKGWEAENGGDALHTSH